MDQSRYIEQKRLQTLLRDRIDNQRPAIPKAGPYTQFKQFNNQEPLPPNPYTPLFPIQHKLVWGRRSAPTYGLLRGHIGPRGPTPDESPEGPKGPLGWYIQGPMGPIGPKDTFAWNQTLSDIQTLYKIAISSSGEPPTISSASYIGGNASARHVHGSLLFSWQQINSDSILDIDYARGSHYEIEMSVNVTSHFQIRLQNTPPDRSFTLSLRMEYSHTTLDRWICTSVRIGEDGPVYSIRHAGGFPLPSTISVYYNQTISAFQSASGEWIITSIGNPAPTYGLLRGFMGPRGPTPDESPEGPKGPRGESIQGPMGLIGPKDTFAWNQVLSDVHTLHKIAISTPGTTLPISSASYIDGNASARHVHGSLLFSWQQINSDSILDIDYARGSHYEIEMSVNVTSHFQIRLQNTPPDRSFTLSLRMEYPHTTLDRWICTSVRIGEDGPVYSIRHAGGFPLPSTISVYYNQTISAFQSASGEWIITSIGNHA